MRHAIISNGKVVNIIIISPENLASMSFDADAVVCVEGTSVGIGWEYDGKDFVAPATPPTEPEPEALTKPWEWLIDVGSFFDRFGATKMAVLTSSDAGVQAILKDTQVRKWIDLKHPDVASSIVYIGTKVPSVTQELQESILNTPVAEIENLALRKLYFS